MQILDDQKRQDDLDNAERIKANEKEKGIGAFKPKKKRRTEE